MSMSGHSKWSKIKREKETKDKQKGNVFSKLSHLITLAVIDGGGIKDPESNVKLRLAIEKAKKVNMPKVNIDRAIEKGVGPDGQQLRQVIYEAFAPGGISLIILATSDNVNRTLSEVRNVVESHGGKLGNQGSVLHLFKKCGLTVFKASEETEEAVLGFADKIGAFDIDKDEEFYLLYFPYELIGKIKEYLTGLKVDSIEVDYKPYTLVDISDKNLAKKVLELIAHLESLDDVQKVYTNFNIPNEFIN